MSTFAVALDRNALVRLAAARHGISLDEAARRLDAAGEALAERLPSGGWRIAPDGTVTPTSGSRSHPW